MHTTLEALHKWSLRYRTSLPYSRTGRKVKEHSDETDRDDEMKRYLVKPNEKLGLYTNVYAVEKEIGTRNGLIENHCSVTSKLSKLLLHAGHHLFRAPRVGQREETIFILRAA